MSIPRNMNNGFTEFEEFLRPALAAECGQANVEVYFNAYKACVEVLINNERILTGHEYTYLEAFDIFLWNSEITHHFFTRRDTAL